jgi:hypothetical protein
MEYCRPVTLLPDREPATVLAGPFAGARDEKLASGHTVRQMA